MGYWIFDASNEWIFSLIYYIFDVKDPRVLLEASTGFYLFIVLRIVVIQMFYCLSSMTGSQILCQVVVFMVPGYYPLRTLGRFDNTGRRLELIKEKIETF